MIYKKPKDTSYTDMCIYIDNNIYGEYDESLVFEYLYHIMRMLSIQGKLFSKEDDYEKFALFAASRLLMRLINPKQFKVNEDGQPVMDKIKSILNYAKKTLQPMRVDYQQAEYSQIVSQEAVEGELNYNFDNIVSKTIRSLHISDFEMTMQNVGKTCEHFLSSLPYDKSSTEWLNIYISVMLTFLNTVTLRNKSKAKLNRYEEVGYLKDQHIEDAYAEETASPPILYHLPLHMSNYISVLSRQLRNIIAKDLCEILHTQVCSDFQLVEYSVNEFIEESLKRDEDKN
jgi:hypothetical protein